jgi:hypothetical protein
MCTQTEQQNPALASPTTIDLTLIPTEEQHNKIITQGYPTKATKTKDETKDEHLDRNGQCQPIIVTFKEPEQKKDIPEQPTYMDERQEYMKWHYKLNHASQETMTKMAQQKILPHFITKILKKMEKTGGKPTLCNNY